jgi:hypothetical protein
MLIMSQTNHRQTACHDQSPHNNRKFTRKSLRAALLFISASLVCLLCYLIRNSLVIDSEELEETNLVIDNE